MSVVNKQVRGGYVITKFHGSGTIYLNSANPVLGANSAGESVEALNLLSADWSIGNNIHVTVQRGSNTILILTAGQGIMDLADGRIIDGQGGNPQANVVVTKVGSGPMTLIMKFHKRSAITGGSKY